MATQTTNYGFQKPDDDDFYDIQVQNGNWDRADEKLKVLEEGKVSSNGGDISETRVKTLEAPQEEFPVPQAGEGAKTFFGKVKKNLEDWKNFKDGIITLGKLVNNGQCTEPGFALDARYGKTLAEKLAACNVNYEQLNSNITYKNLTSGFDLNDALGRYRSAADAVVTTLIHKPDSITNGEITVDWFPADVSNLHGIQTIHHTTSGYAMNYYIRACRSGNWGGWNKLIKDTDLNANSSGRMVAGSVVKDGNYHRLRLQIETHGDNKYHLCAYDDNDGTVIGNITMS